MICIHEQLIRQCYVKETHFISGSSESQGPHFNTVVDFTINYTV